MATPDSLGLAWVHGESTTAINRDPQKCWTSSRSSLALVMTRSGVQSSPAAPGIFPLFFNNLTLVIDRYFVAQCPSVRRGSSKQAAPRDTLSAGVMRLFGGISLGPKNVAPELMAAALLTVELLHVRVFLQIAGPIRCFHIEHCD